MPEERRRIFYRPESLEELMTQDPHDLLAPEKLPKMARTVTRVDRIGSRHQELYDFIREHGRLPAVDAPGRSERSLASRLSTLQSVNPAEYRMLAELADSGTEAAEQLEQMAPGLSISRGSGPLPQDGPPPSAAAPGASRATAAAGQVQTTSMAAARGGPAAAGDAAQTAAVQSAAAASAPAAPAAAGAPAAVEAGPAADEQLQEEGPDPAEPVLDEELVLEDIDDLINNDPLGLLSGVVAAPPDDRRWREGRVHDQAGGRHSLDNIIARATPCPNFYRYERFFEEIDQHLQQGTLTTENIVGTSGKINVGDIFVLGGITAIVAGAEAAAGKYKDSSKIYRRERWRLDLIYDNGKQSNITAEALRASFYKKTECLRVVQGSYAGAEYLQVFRSELQQLREGHGGRVASGILYILASRSTAPELLQFTANSSLVKVGATRTTVERRIANAENEDTYLFAKVRIVGQFTCYDTDPFELERIVHAFLHTQRLTVELTDNQGRKYRPREWFTVSAETVKEVVRHVMARDINLYRIDPVRGQLVTKAGVRV